MRKGVNKVALRLFEHISVKGRGLLLLDFNQVWGDGTTISFYWVSVPF